MSDVDPNVAELEALRKDKADREASDKKKADDERAAELAELAELRTARDAAAKTPPKKVVAPPKAEEDAKPKVTHGASKLWFG